MSWRSDSSQLFAGKWTSSLYAGHGIQAKDIPSTGESGPAALYNDIAGHGAAPTDEMMWEILTVPASGVFTPYESSEFTLIGADDGVHFATYRGRRNGVVYGDYTVTMTIGDASPQLAGAARFPRFHASGQLNVTAQPSMITGSSRFPKFSARGVMTVQPGEAQISSASTFPSLSMTGTLIVYYSQATGDPLWMKQQLENERRGIEERNNQPN